MLMRKLINVHFPTQRFIEPFLPLLFSHENIPVLRNILDAEVQKHSNKSKVIGRIFKCEDIPSS